jgi:transposase
VRISSESLSSVNCAKLAFFGRSARLRGHRLQWRLTSGRPSRSTEGFGSAKAGCLFGSLPGAGPKIAPRLLGEIGSDRSRFEDPTALQCLGGTAPVSYQSGKIHKVYLRRHCNKLLRQAVHLWANPSRQSCPWAALYYEQLRTRGKNHACALRSLGQRWLLCPEPAPHQTRPAPAWSNAPE